MAGDFDNIKPGISAADLRSGSGGAQASVRSASHPADLDITLEVGKARDDYGGDGHQCQPSDD